MQHDETLAFLAACLPQALTNELRALDMGRLLEIRLRANKPVQFKLGNAMVQGTFTPDRETVAHLSEALCEHSLYARYDEARRGFVTLRGGHRMGLCGHVLMEKDEVLKLTDITSLSIRIAREVRGAAEPLLGPLRVFETLPSVLIIGSPGTGKTTLLRDLIREVSNSGITVGVNDERGELAACQQGLAQLELGPSTDVLDGCQKAKGIQWLIRSMSPMVIATDEISGMEDSMALLDAIASGIRVFASVHAGNFQDVMGRSDLSVLFHRKAFDLYVLLKHGDTGVIEALYDKEGMQWQ